MKRFAYLIWIFAVLSSCSTGPNIETELRYASSVSGLFLDEVEEDLCSVEISLGDYPLENLWDVIYSDEFSDDLLVVGVQLNSGVRITVASPSICDDVSIGYLADIFNISGSGIEIVSSSAFLKEDTARIIRSRGLDDVDVSFLEFYRDDCAVVRPERGYASLDEIMILRYRSALPVLYYNSNGTDEVWVFEKGCKNAGELVEIIDEIRHRYSNHYR